MRITSTFAYGHFLSVVINRSFFSSHVVLAQPSNDLCTDAAPLIIGTDILANITGATVESGMTASDDCIDSSDTLYPGVWYSFVGTGEELVSRTCASIFISIFSGGCSVSTRTCVVGFNSNQMCTRERLRFNTVFGTTYHVLVQSLYNGIFDFSIFTPPLVPNDKCNNAEPLTIGSTITVDTTYAIVESGMTSLDDCIDSTNTLSPGVWYTFNGTGGELVARSCRTYSVSISIFSGGCSSPLRTCVLGLSSDQVCDRERFRFNTVIGTNYYVLVQSDSDEIVDLSIFAPPTVPNDECSNADPLTIGSTITANTTYATVEYGMTALDDCIDTSNYLYPGVWYTFVGTGGELVARSCNSFSTISIFSGGCGASTRACVLGLASDQVCGPERFRFNTVIGTTYYVLLQSYYGDVDLLIFTPPPVLNDECINAEALTIGSTITSNTTYASSESNVNPSEDCIEALTNSYPGVWYTFNGTGGYLAVQSCLRFYVYISIYSGGCNASTRTCVVGFNNDEICSGLRTMFHTVLGTTYHVLVQSAYDDIVDLSIFTPPPVPNDECSNAELLKIGSTITVNTTYATVESGMTALDDCIDTTDTLYPGLWYTFVGTGTELVARSCNINSPYVSVFSGGCGSSSRTCVAGITAFNLCDRSPFRFNTVRGITYHVLVQSQYGGIVDLSIFTPPRVPNDECTKASKLKIGSTIFINTTYARSETSITASDDCIDTEDPLYPGVWYTFVGTGGELVVSSCDVYYKYISIYSGGCSAFKRKCVAGIKDSEACYREKFRFKTIRRTTYHVLVQSYYDELINLSIFTPPTVRNDLCKNAKSVSLRSTVKVNATFATTDIATVFSDCIDGDEQLYPGVWFSFVGTGGPIVLRSCELYGTYISIFTGSCGRSTLQCVAGTRDSCADERFVIESNRGTKYKVLVQTSSEGVVDLMIFDVVKNDLCVDAQPLTLGLSVAGNVTYALPDSDKVFDSCGGVFQYYDPGVWFSFVGTGGRIALDPCVISKADDITYVSVYKDGCDPLALACAASSQIQCGRNQFVFDSGAGITYNVLVQAPKVKAFKLLVFSVLS